MDMKVNETIIDEICEECNEKEYVIEILYNICKNMKYDREKTKQRIIKFYKRKV